MLASYRWDSLLLVRKGGKELRSEDSPYNRPPCLACLGPYAFDMPPCCCQGWSREVISCLGNAERQKGSQTGQYELEILDFGILLLVFLPVQLSLWTTSVPVNCVCWHRPWRCPTSGGTGPLGVFSWRSVWDLLSSLCLLRPSSTQSTRTFPDHLVMSTSGKPDAGHAPHCTAVRFIEMVEASKGHFNPLKFLVGLWERQHQKAPSQTF